MSYRVLDKRPVLIFQPPVIQKAIFGMSWFWAPEALYGAVKGVIRTRVGYVVAVQSMIPEDDRV